MGTEKDASLQLTVNGKRVAVAPGLRLLDALDSLGIHVPRLCYDPRFRPSEACRICEVTVAGHPRPLCACGTPVQEGMELETHSGALEKFRRGILSLLAQQYPAQGAAKFEHTLFQKYLRQYGVPISGAARDRLVDMTHPYIQVDMRRCIECYRCVHICDQLQGQFVWKIMGKTDATEVIPDSGTTLLESSCTSCGACVDSCPTGALEDFSVIKKGWPTRWTKTTCPYCGVGCELNVGVVKDEIAVIRPVIDSPVSKGHLCSKGRYAYSFVDAEDRILRPMVKRDGKWSAVSWAEALKTAAKLLQDAKTNYGADSVGVLGSARATNEDSYLAQKFSRLVLETNNVDCCARVCHAPSAAGLGAMLGTGAATNSYDDIEHAGAFLIVGSNTTENHPIVGARIKQRVIQGIPLIVVDPRLTEIAEYATVHLAIRSGTNIPLLNSLACTILEEDLLNRSFVQDRTDGFEAWAQAMKAWTPERIAPICGVDPAQIREAARIYARSRPAMSFHGLGLTEHSQGTDGVMSLVNLALLTGNLGVRGGGVNPLRGQNNVQGTAVMGCEPNKLTGSQSISKARQLHEEIWKKPIPSTRGLNLMEMMDAAGAGRLKTMLVIGYDFYLTNPNANATAEALSKLESMIVVDLFMTETANQFANVFLPCTSSFEKEGTFMNAERRIQRVRKALSIRGEAKPDWVIISELASELGAKDGFSFNGPEEIWNEIRSLWPAVFGMTYDRLDLRGLQWPCPTTEHPGTEVLHVEEFTAGDRAVFRIIEFLPTEETVSEEFPFLLSTGRSLYRFNAETMTGRTKNPLLGHDGVLEMHPADAEKLELSNGARIKVESRYGSFSSNLLISNRVKPGRLFTTFHDVPAFINRVTGPYVDPATHTPEYKVTAVRISP